MRLVLTFIVALLFTLATPVRAIGVMPAPAVDTEETVAAAKAEHKAMLEAMSPKQRRQYQRAQRQEVKSAIKAHKQAQKNGTAVDDSNLLIIIITILIPPLGVALYEGGITGKFWISLLLTLLFYVPGLIYSLLVVTGNAKK